MSDKDRAQNVYLAKLAEQAERYEEMARSPRSRCRSAGHRSAQAFLLHRPRTGAHLPARRVFARPCQVEYMKKVCKQTTKGEDLSVEERNLVSVAFKNVVGARRAACRVIQTIHDQCSSEGKDDDDVTNKKGVVAEYKNKVETELHTICMDAISLVKDTLIANSTAVEAKVFYRKMAGDYFRYLCEFKTGDARNDVKEKAMEQYKLATETATADGAGLASTHPIRLGLALNFSVCTFFFLLFAFLLTPSTRCAPVCVFAHI